MDGSRHAREKKMRAQRTCQSGWTAVQACEYVGTHRRARWCIEQQSHLGATHVRRSYSTPPLLHMYASVSTADDEEEIIIRLTDVAKMLPRTTAQ